MHISLILSTVLNYENYVPAVVIKVEVSDMRRDAPHFLQTYTVSKSVIFSVLYDSSYAKLRYVATQINLDNLCHIRISTPLIYVK